MVVLTGVVLGGLALAQEAPPQPAAPTPVPSTTPAPTPTPTPSPTPSATPETPAVVLPTGDPTLPFGACGSLATSAPAAPVDPAFSATAVPYVTSAVAGGAVAVTSEVGVGAYGRYGAVHPGGARVSVLRDGVVVGSTSVGRDTWVVDEDGGSDVPIGVDWLPLAVCGPETQPGVSAGAPLPAGDYEILPWSDVVALGSSWEALTGPDGVRRDAEDLVAELGTPATAVGTPTTITVTGTADAMAPLPFAGEPPRAPVASPPLTCGDPAPVADPANPVHLSSDLVGATLTPADLASVTSSLTYEGGGRMTIMVGAVHLLALSEGRIVGNTPLYYEGGALYELAGGLPLGFTEPVYEPVACVPGEPVYTSDVPLGAGTYEVVIAVEVMPVAGPQEVLWASVPAGRATLVVG
jgi:hypothetical protein